MTKERLIQKTKAQLESFEPKIQEVVLCRAVGRPVVAWDLLTVVEINNIIGACAMARVLFY